MNSPVVLVTGASGLIGSHVVDHLLAQGCRVVGLATGYPLRAVGLRQFASAGYIPVTGDICDRTLLDQLLRQHQPSHVIHLAAQALVGNANRAAEATFETNIRGTWRLLEAVRQYGQLRGMVVASSDKAYGQHPVLPYREDFELRAVFPYDLSKKITEELALGYFHTYGLPVAITRCGNVFGPFDLNPSRIVPGTIRSCLRHEPVVLRSSGHDQRCYVHAADVARAYHAVMMALPGVAAGEAFNIGNDRPVSVIDMARSICRKMHRDVQDIVIENSARNEIASQTLDCTRIKALLGWEEELSLDDALEETIAWYRSVHQQFPNALPWKDV